MIGREKPQRVQREIDVKKALCSQDAYPLSKVTKEIISCCIEVHTKLGSGLLENIYEEALAYAFTLRKIKYERQKVIKLKYKRKEVGLHRIDFLLEGDVVLEIKAAESINEIFVAQVLTYLKAMEKKVGLLINFNVIGLKEGIKRVVL